MDWGQREMNWYRAGLEANRYPENVIEFIDSYLSYDFRLLDIGCGIGTLTLSLIKRVNEVIGLDKSKTMLEYLKKLAAQKGIGDSVLTKQGDWRNLCPQEDIPPVQVIVSAYSGKEIYGQDESIYKLDQTAQNYVFLLVPGERKKHSFGTDQLFEMLGRNQRTRRIFYQDVISQLKNLNIDYNIKHFDYNFGQPFSSFSEAEDFFSFHYNINEPTEKEILRSFLKERLTSREDRLWVDNFKKSSLIWWETKSNRQVVRK